jgi:hypothetical protein
VCTDQGSVLINFFTNNELGVNDANNYVGVSDDASNYVGAINDVKDR